MRGDLRCNYVGKNLLARAHYGCTCFVTGAFDAEDGRVGHNGLGLSALGFGLSALGFRLSLYAFQFRRLGTCGGEPVHRSL
jgi:hypothetical protein